MKKTVEIIAEAGVNHNGSKTLALELISAAAEAGADTVKFQTFDPEALASAGIQKANYQKVSSGAEETQLQLLSRLRLDRDDHYDLLVECEKRGVAFLSTPFDLGSLEFLVKDLGLNRLKVGSGDMTNAPLLHGSAQYQCEIILSTGMSNLSEVEIALGILGHGFDDKNETPPNIEQFRSSLTKSEIWNNLRDKVTLLHCTTEYPAPYQGINLLAMNTLSSSFGLRIGYSDHSIGNAVSIAAVARGASVIEKHFTLDKKMEGPDHSASLEPHELSNLVRDIRAVEKSLGNGIKQPADSERQNINVIRKCLVASRSLKKGEIFDLQSITTKRAGAGASPLFFFELIGKRVDRDYQKDEPIDFGLPLSN